MTLLLGYALVLLGGALIGSPRLIFGAGFMILGLLIVAGQP